MSVTHVELMVTPTVNMMRPGRSRRFCIMDGTVEGDDPSVTGVTAANGSSCNLELADRGLGQRSLAAESTEEEKVQQPWRS
jgi:hypothetical protein